MNGGAGLRRRCFFSTCSTTSTPPAAASRASRAACASVPAVKVNCLTFSPRYSDRRALTGALAVCARASMVQYSRGSKRSISSSRSTIRRSAGLCTRPADNPRLIFFHSSGERLNPTR